ncbi:MAG: AI-2E family transporter [Deltaproteobacteria bacterium]|nr:AI-2E family transporter [Deltaproteobacteria bacterium]
MSREVVHWYRHLRSLFDPQVVLIWIMGLILVGLVVFLGKALLPFFIAVVLAYMLDRTVELLVRLRCPHWLAVIVVFCCFVVGGITLLVWLVPLVVRQMLALIDTLPAMANTLQQFVINLQARYVSNLDPAYLEDAIPRLTLEAEALIRRVAKQTLTILPSLFSWVIYLVLVPILIFFFLLDKKRILGWISRLLPDNRRLFSHLMDDINRQMGRFLLGKFWEMSIVSAVSISTFVYLGLNFGVLLGLLSGVSVIVPYLGVMAVTIPILLVAFFQFGITAGFLKVAIAYLIIQILEGNILAPVMVGNMVRVHPAAIILSLFICGHLWGFWGVVFGFPLAIVVKSVLELVLPYLRQDSGEAPPDELSGKKDDQRVAE